MMLVRFAACMLLMVGLSPALALAQAAVEPRWSIFPGFHVPGKDGIQIVDLEGDGRKAAIVTGASEQSFGYRGHVFLAVIEWSGSKYEITRKVLLDDGDIFNGEIRRISWPGHVGDALAVPIVRDDYSNPMNRLRILGGQDLTLLHEIGLPHNFLVRDVIDLDDNGIVEVVGFVSSSQWWGGVPMILDATTGDTLWSDPSRTVRFMGAGDVGLGARVLVLGNDDPPVGRVLDAGTRELLWEWPDGFAGEPLFGNFLEPESTREFAIVPSWGVTRVFRAAPSFSPMAQFNVGEAATRTAADIDNDGFDEIVIGARQWGGIVAYQPRTNWSIAFEVQNPEHGVSAVEIGRLNDSGTQQLIHGAGITSTGPDILRVIDIDSGAVQYHMVDEEGPHSNITLGEFSGTGRGEVAYTIVQSQSGRYGSDLILLDQDRGEEFARSNSVANSWGYGIGATVKAVQLDDDPQHEIVVGSGQNFVVRALDGQTLEPQWSRTESNLYRVDDLIVVNINNDSVPDVGVVTEGGLVFLDGRDGAEIWRTVTFNIDGAISVASGAIGTQGSLGVAIGVGTRVYVLDMIKQSVARFYVLEDEVIGQHVETVAGECLHVLVFAAGIQRRSCDTGEIHSERDFPVSAIYAGFPTDSFGYAVLSDGERVTFDLDGQVIFASEPIDRQLGWHNRGQVRMGHRRIEAYLGGALGVHRVDLDFPLFQNGFELP